MNEKQIKEYRKEYYRTHKERICRINKATRYYDRILKNISDQWEGEVKIPKDLSHIKTTKEDLRVMRIAVMSHIKEINYLRYNKLLMNEIMGQAYLSLLDILSTFDPKKCNNRNGFLFINIKNKLRTDYKIENIKNNKIKTTSLEFEITENIKVIDNITCGNEVLEQRINKEYYHFFISKFFKLLSKKEKKVFLLIRENADYSYDYIASKIGSSEKSVDNTITRIKRKGEQFKKTFDVPEF